MIKQNSSIEAKQEWAEIKHLHVMSKQMQKDKTKIWEKI